MNWRLFSSRNSRMNLFKVNNFHWSNFFHQSYFFDNPQILSTKMDKYQQFSGSMNFRQRLICSTLSGVPIEIKDIRLKDKKIGLRDYEGNFLKLLECMTKGTEIEINERGTSLKYKPGVILGTQFLKHDCNVNRGIGYYLEALCCLAPFAKERVTITLTGITNHPKDLSIDVFRNVTFHLMKKFGFEEAPTIQIMKRGAPPLGGGEIIFDCPTVKKLTSIQLVDEGMIRRIRGIAYSTRVSPGIPNRIIESSRELLNQFIPDVWVFTDHYAGKKSGASPGFGLMLQAETDKDCRLAVEVMGDKGTVPEDLGKFVSELLCQEIKKGGCIDSSNQWLAFLFMALCPEDVSKLRIGKLSEYGIQMLRNIDEFFGVRFKMDTDFKTSTVVLTCVGSGFKNLNKKSN
jgi:RNA 3'-terminal phosphate cyclase-like protein